MTMHTGLRWVGSRIGQRAQGRILRLPAESSTAPDGPDGARRPGGRRGFLAATLAGVGAAAAGLVRPGGVPTVHADHGATNFTSDDYQATVHAINTRTGAALLGTNSNPSSPTVPGIGVQGEATGNGDGWGVLAERKGSGKGLALVAFNLSTANGDAASIDRDNVAHDTASGNALNVDRRGRGDGHTLVARRLGLEEKGDGHAVIARAWGPNGRAVFAERSENGAGDGVLSVLSGTPATNGAALHGIAPGNNAAVLAESGSANGETGNLSALDSGVALRVRGQALFSTVGSTTIPAGANVVTVANSLVTATSHISVTLASDPGKDVSVVWVERNPGVGFTVHLNKNTDNATSLTYFIVESTT